jgi:hypothetical protein
VHPLPNDLLLSGNLPRRVGRPSSKKWSPLFYPKAFAQEHDDITVERFKLTDRQLTKYGTEVTKIRRDIKEEAEILA